MKGKESRKKNKKKMQKLEALVRVDQRPSKTVRLSAEVLKKLNQATDNPIEDELEQKTNNLAKLIAQKQARRE